MKHLLERLGSTARGTSNRRWIMPGRSSAGRRHDRTDRHAKRGGSRPFAGGYTTLAAAAQYDLKAFNARCAELPPDDPNILLCRPWCPMRRDGARGGLDPVPEGLWPSFGDPRVTAILPMASNSYLFDRAGLSKITVPMMAIGGTADTVTPYEWGIGPAYQYASSARRRWWLWRAPSTASPAASCETLPALPRHPIRSLFLLRSVLDKNRAHDLMNDFDDRLPAGRTQRATPRLQLPSRQRMWRFRELSTQPKGYMSGSAAGLDEETVAKIETLIDSASWRTVKSPAPQSGIVKDGELVYAKGFGVTELGSDTAGDAHSVFHMASIAKSVTGMAITQLVVEDKIDLHAPW